MRLEREGAGPDAVHRSARHGTYSFVVRSCRGAQLDPNFERGSTRLQNAMKAAVLPARH